MEKLIILVSGRKGSGKNTFCDQIVGIAKARDPRPFLVDVLQNDRTLARMGCLHSFSWIILSFAEPIRRFCEEVFGIPAEHLYGTEADKNRPTHLRWEDVPGYDRLWFKSGYMTVREVMQVFGTDIVRAWDENAWARAAAVKAMESEARLVLFSDLRFPNEMEAFEAIRDDGRAAVKFVRLLRRALADDNHESEKAMDGMLPNRWDMIVPGNLTVNGQRDYMTPRVTCWLEEAGL